MVCQVHQVFNAIACNPLKVEAPRIKDVLNVNLYGSLTQTSRNLFLGTYLEDLRTRSSVCVLLLGFHCY